MLPTINHSPVDVDALRQEEFPFVRESIYLNSASVTPTPERTRRAVQEFNWRRSHIHELDDSDFEAPLDRCRAAAARLIGAAAEEIALGGNTSFGINLAAQCLPLEHGARVVVSDREFPANVYPWMRGEAKGVTLELVPADSNGLPDEERILERLDRGDVSVFALSAVQFATGYRADVARFGEFCRERGIYFVVDGIQALGQVPIDVREMKIDVLAAGGPKWLCGPFGTGFAYVRRELVDRLEPSVIGWKAMRACEDYTRLTDYQWEFLPDARKFEVGTLPFQDFLGLAHSIELLLEVGIDRVQAHVAQLLDPLIHWLQEQPGVQVVSDLRAGHRSGIFCFRPPAAEAAFAALRQADVVCVLREGAIRLSPHLFNTPGEIDRVLEVLAHQEQR